MKINLCLRQEGEMLVIGPLVSRKVYKVFLDSISIKLFSVSPMKLSRQEQYFSQINLTCQDGKRVHIICYSYFWREKNAGFCPTELLRERMISFPACSHNPLALPPKTFRRTVGCQT